MKRFDARRVGRVLDRIFAGVVASGLLMMMIWLGLGVYRGSWQPFPTFGGDGQIDQVAHWLFRGFGCFWLIWAFSFGLRASAQDRPKPASLLLLSLLPALLGALTWTMSLPMLNALLDVSPKTVTTINVQRTSSSTSRTETGSMFTTHSALVNRLDHPDEQVEINWDAGCTGGIPSRIVTIRLGRGAFGVPWFSLPVGCRPLAIDERPLFDDFYLGKGRAAVVITYRTGDPQDRTAEVHGLYAQKKRDLLARLTNLAEGRSRLPEADVNAAMNDASGLLSEEEREQLKRLLDWVPGPKENEMPTSTLALRFVQAALLKTYGDLQLAHWTQAIEHRFPNTEVVVIADSMPLDSAERASCPRCRVSVLRATDPEILWLFRAGLDPAQDDDRIYLADARGQRVFAADLRDVDQEPRLLDKLAAASTPPR